MKKILMLTGLFLALLTIQAQESRDYTKEHPLRSIYIGAMGGSGLVNVSFDSRIKGNRGWGYRVGIGYNYQDNGFNNAENIVTYGTNWKRSSDILSRYNGFLIPIEVNYLVGKKQHQFEAGAGVNLGYLRERRNIYTLLETTDAPSWNEHGEGSTITEDHSFQSGSRNDFAYLIYNNIGYRLQCPKGFQLRAGLTIAPGMAATGYRYSHGAASVLT